MRTHRVPRRRGWLRNRPGQGAVEFALIAPILLLLLFGMVEFARGWSIRHAITDAAREGARYLAVDNGIVADQVRNQIIPGALAASGVKAADAAITLACNAGCEEPGIIILPNDNPAVRVSIVYPYELRLIRVLLGWAIGDAQITIRSSYTMRSEG